MTPSPSAGGSSSPDAPLLPSEAAAAASERPCPECGEKVRSGMVRCFNCGAFLRKEIADKYAEMQAKPPQIIFSELPEGAAEAVGDVDDEGDDFELNLGSTYALAGASSNAAGEAPPAADAEAPASTERPAGRTPAAPEAGPSHSVATAGDVLLQGALSEQQEQKRRRKERGVSLRGGARTPGGFVIYCPYGCRIEVKDQHRGMTGACPKCRAPFIVPVEPPDYDFREREARVAAEQSSESPSGQWTPWLADLHLHQVAPEKLKLKPGSLVKEFVEVDAAFSPQGLLLINLAIKKSGGLFGGGSGNDKKKPEARAAVQQHLKENKPLNEAPAADVRMFTPEELAQIRVVQPAANPLESMFAGIPVFGEHVIALQLPLSEGRPPQCLSFQLSGFRTFAAALQQTAGGPTLSALGVPAEDVFVDYKCHYTDVPIRALQNVEWYQADPASGVTIAGWKCAACGLAISEDARKKENIGGKGGKAIAKAKCPKCNNKFGEQPLYTLPSQLASASLAEGAAAT